VVKGFVFKGSPLTAADLAPFLILPSQLAEQNLNRSPKMPLVFMSVRMSTFNKIMTFDFQIWYIKASSFIALQ